MYSAISLWWATDAGVIVTRTCRVLPASRTICAVLSTIGLPRLPPGSGRCRSWIQSGPSHDRPIRSNLLTSQKALPADRIPFVATYRNRPSPRLDAAASVASRMPSARRRSSVGSPPPCRTTVSGRKRARQFAATKSAADLTVGIRIFVDAPDRDAAEQQYPHAELHLLLGYTVK